MKNRGGLWKVKSDVITIFTISESYFLSATKDFVSKIDADSIISLTLEDAIALSYFNSLRRSIHKNVKKKVALNLPEDMLTLYIRVRSHSYAKDKQQLHKISKDKTKSRSLRTEIKKQAASFDTGH